MICSLLCYQTSGEVGSYSCKVHQHLMIKANKYVDYHSVALIAYNQYTFCFIDHHCNDKWDL